MSTQNSHSLETYEYAALNPSQREIRVLILRSRVDANAEVHCNLIHQSLSQGVGETCSYVALSYVWGSKDNPKTIYLDGKPVEVTRNLYSALDQFSQRNKDIHMWVDALCINQRDNDERTSQVVMMSTIYTRAGSTFMWLGSGEYNSGGPAMELLAEWAGRRAAGYLDIEHDLEFEPSRKDKLKWEELHRLLEQPYWRRVWIIQEILLSRDPVLCCGSYKLPWTVAADTIVDMERFDAFGYARLEYGEKRDEEFTRQTRELGKRLRESRKARDAMESGQEQESEETIQKREQLIREAEAWVTNRFSEFDVLVPIELAHLWRSYSRGETMTLLRALLAGRLREATDNRDRVYSLLNLAQTEGNMLSADYDKDICSLYRDMAVHFLSTSKDLRILSACIGFKTNDVDESKIIPKTLDKELLPSWVPDWREYVEYSGYLLLNPSVSPSFSAAGITSSSFAVSKDAGVLLAEGVYFDRIKSTSPSLVDVSKDAIPGMLRDEWNLWCYHTRGKTEKFDFITRHMALRTLWRFVGPHPLEKAPYGNEENQLEAFRGTLVLGDAEQEGQKLFRYDRVFGDRIFATFIDHLSFLDKDLPLGLKSEIDSLLSSMRKLDRVTNGVPRFFITESGYMGRGPHALRVDDVIVVLLGGEVPFVLRPIGNGYILIGECYVHGIMGGELISELNRGERTKQGFGLF
ncbi:HET-domain-containing protein [Cenococcum geophilum]